MAALPLSFHRKMAKALGRFCGRCLRYRRDSVMVNLSRCFPEKNYDELISICDKFYHHFAKIFCEAIWFGGRNAGSLRKSGIVTIKNPEYIGALHKAGRSVLVVSSHTGNWELYGGIESYCGHGELGFNENDVCVVYKKLTSPAMDRFMKANRCAALKDKEHYEGLLESFDVLRYAITHRHDQKLYIFNSDQYPYTAKARIPIEFMGQPTWAMDGATNLAHKLGMALVYLSYTENEDGNYTMEFKEISEDASREDSHDLLLRYYGMIEESLRKQEWNYLWTHRRWK